MLFHFLPDFIDLQKLCFHAFLKKGIIEELNKRNPISNIEKTFEFFFYSNYYKLSPPKWNIQQAIFYGKSYSAKLYVPAHLINRKTKQIQIRWILLGNLPLMTKRGHFVINGASRVVINQIIRGPGIYYNQMQDNNDSFEFDEGSIRYYADIISSRGTWLRLSIDKKKFLWAEMKKTPKIPLLWFLLCMGLNQHTIFQCIRDSNFLLQNFLPNQKGEEKRSTKKPAFFFLNSPKKAFQLMGSKILFDYSKLTKKNQNQICLQTRRWLFKRFMNPRTYDLGLHGRLCLNRKLGLNLSKENRTLTPQDILFATDYLIELQKRQATIDDIDHLKNRRVRTSSDLIQTQLSIALLRLEKIIRDKIDIFHIHSQTSFLSLKQKNTTLFSQNQNQTKIFFQKNMTLFTDLFLANKKKKTNLKKFPLMFFEKTKSKVFLKNVQTYHKNQLFLNKSMPKIGNLITTQAMNGALREFFGTSPLSQFMDQINPLAEITHKRRLTSLGPGGISRDTATMVIRGIHPTHYGRICPVETPEGKNAGLVNVLTTYAKLDENGLIQSPFYKVYKGQIQKKAGVFYLSAAEEEELTLAASDMCLSSINFLSRWSVAAKTRNTFTKVTRQEIDMIGVSPLQMISVATALVPFLEHDDANRALMGANMQRQAVSIVRPEQPIVCTGLEAKAISDSGQSIEAKHGGVVSYASAKKICVYTF
jgi:DNA-directed RNA polymerase subunit beta